MTLPTTGTITLTQVCDEKGVPHDTSLVTLCTTDVNPASQVQPSSSPPYSLLSFRGYNHSATFGQLPTPSCSASWNSSLNRMEVVITPGAGMPASTTIDYRVFRRYTGTGDPAVQIGTATATGSNTTQFNDTTATETAFAYAYSVQATAQYWDPSAVSAEDTAFVGA